MITTIVLIATIISDIAIGAAAYALARSNEKSTEALTKLLTAHNDRLDGHEARLTALEDVVH